MSPIFMRSAILAAKLESVIGTAEALAAADAGFRVQNPMLKPSGTAAVVTAGTGNADIAVVPGQYSGELSFDLELYSGAWKDILLPSCGFSDAVTAGTFLFCDDTTLWKAMTGGLFYGADKVDGVFGAMGSLSLNLVPGQTGVMSFAYRGVYNAAPGTAPTGVTWETAKPPVFARAGALTIGADATIACGNVNLSSGSNVALIPSPNVAGGFLQAWLKKPTFRFKVDPITLAAKNWITDFVGGTSTTISAVLNGGAGNTITISATVAQVTTPDQKDQDEYLMTPLEFAVLNNSLSIIFS